MSPDQNFWEESNNNVVTDRDEDIVVTGLDAPPPELDTWGDAELKPKLIKNILKEKFVRPRKFQRIAIPLIMQGYDLKGHAEAGSGKTASFVIPIIHNIMSTKISLKKSDINAAFKQLTIKNSAEPYSVFIAPTRELANQAYSCFRTLSIRTKVHSILCIGGIPLKQIKNEINKGCDIICATPGRLIELIEKEIVKFDKLKFVVLDEIDKLFEMGYSAKNKCTEEDMRCLQKQECMYHQIQQILQSNGFPDKEERQTLVFSATFAQDTQKLVNKVLLKKTNCMVTNKKFELPNLRIQQEFIEVLTNNKLVLLLELLKKDTPDDDRNSNAKKGTQRNKTKENLKRTLIFVNLRSNVYKLTRYLQKNDINADGIERFNYQRQKTLDKFCQNKIQVLVSSDLCGRGIDVRGLTQVINYDIPKDKATYVHRIGRVGRVLEGQALSFFDPQQDQEHANYLVPVLQQTGANIPEYLIKAINNNRFGVSSL
uniref:RNA helicase n=1 Tax=Acrobeloides nanus TaxID=290746 RepID=A0A914CCA6_9BILA